MVQACTVDKIDKRQGKNPACFQCGRKSHTPADCWFKQDIQCQKTGHIQKMFKAKIKEKRNHKDKKKQQNVHNTDEIDASESDCNDQDLACFDVCWLNGRKRGMIWVSTKVEGVTLPMEQDTGSALSV